MAIKEDINRLVKLPSASPRLDDALNPLAIREKTGLERKRASDINAETVTVKSTDGLFTFIVQVVKP